MEVLQIDLKGKMAHFRKYYANNTALSFTIPPRTTIMGMLAAMLGVPKDKYYQQLSSPKIRIGIALLSPVKKTFHRLNFLSIKSIGNLKTDIDKEKAYNSDFRGTGGRIQTPFEIVTGIHLQQDEVCYRLFISAYNAGDVIFNQLKKCMIIRQPYYNLSFGVAGFSAYVNKVQLFEDASVEERQAKEEFIEFNSSVISDKISDLHFKKNNDYSFVEEELMPSDFIADYNRELSKMNRVLFTHNSLPLTVTYTGAYYVLNGKEIIAFLEND